jgi:H+-transporting ATPase
MTGDGVNDAPSLKKADTGIAVEGASDAARSAADIVFLAPGLSAIIDALKTSRQIFHRMYAYVVYRIALSLHLEIFLGLWIVILNTSLNLELVVFIAIFADIATLAIAYDNAPFSKSPVKWNLPKLWGMSVLLGIVLAIGTWITLTTMFPYRYPAASPEEGQGIGGGIVQNFGVRDEVLFLQISLSENWLIFITRANGPFWSSIPSWQLCGAILIVDIIATFFCLFGWFIGGQTSIVAVVRVWIFCFGVFCVLGGLYYILQDSVGFDNLMHGKSPRKDQKQRSLEDFGKSYSYPSETRTETLTTLLSQWCHYNVFRHSTKRMLEKDRATTCSGSDKNQHHLLSHLMKLGVGESLYSCKRVKGIKWTD